MLTLPYPGQPTNGQPLDAVPVLGNIAAIAQAVQSFDGSQIQAGSIVAAALAAGINPNTLLHDTIRPFVQVGCTWSQVSGLQGTMTGGIIYAGTTAAMFRTVVTGVGSNIFAASSDTYVDVDYNGNVTYQAVSNNVASPALTANSIRVAIVVTSGAAITSINQGSPAATVPIISSVALSVTDSLGNLIYPTDPQGKVLGYRQISGALAGLASGSSAQITGLTCPVIVPTGRRVKVTVGGSYWQSANTLNLTQSIWDGVVGSGAQIESSGITFSGANSVFPYGLEAGMILPGASSKTYNAGYLVSTSSVTLQAGNGVAWIKVELE